MKTRVYTQGDISKILAKAEKRTKQVYKDAFKRGVDCCSENVVNMSLIVLQDKFNFTPDQAKQFEDYIYKFSDSIAEGRVSFDDVKETVEYELGETDWSDLKKFRKLNVTPDTVKMLIKQRDAFIAYIRENVSNSAVEDILKTTYEKKGR